jgi:hypothetical protein
MNAHMRKVINQIAREAQAKLDNDPDLNANITCYQNLKEVFLDMAPGMSAYSVLESVVCNVGMKSVLKALLNIQNGNGG